MEGSCPGRVLAGRGGAGGDVCGPAGGDGSSYVLAPGVAVGNETRVKYSCRYYEYLYISI
jgi:hypothetical protein